MVWLKAAGSALVRLTDDTGLKERREGEEFRLSGGGKVSPGEWGVVHRAQPANGDGERRVAAEEAEAEAEQDVAPEAAASIARQE